jgi:hypothetical protein
MTRLGGLYNQITCREYTREEPSSYVGPTAIPTRLGAPLAEILRLFRCFLAQIVYFLWDESDPGLIRRRRRRKKKRYRIRNSFFLFHLEALEEGRSVNRFVAFCLFVRCFVFFFPPSHLFSSVFPKQQHLFLIYPRFVCLFVLLLGSCLSKVPDPLLIWN